MEVSPPALNSLKRNPAYLDLLEVDVCPGVGLASHLECDLPQSPLQVTVSIKTVI
jgi:hypothetical protein